MARLFLLCSTVGALVHLVSGAAIVPTSTEESRPTLVQRDKGIPTITLGPIEQYSNYQGSDKVDKRSVAIFPTGIIEELPSDGMHVVFGPDIQKDMDRVIRDRCKDPKNVDACHGAIDQLLRDTSLNAHAKRVIPVIAAATVAELIQAVTVAIAAALGLSAVAAGADAVAPPSINYADTSPDGVMAQLQSVDDATAIAIATGVDNKIMGTVTVAPGSTPTPKPEDALRITEITTDQGEDKAGDIIIEVPETIAKNLQEFLSENGLDQAKQVCAGNHMKRDHIVALNKRMPTLAQRCAAAVLDLTGITLEATQNALVALNPQNANNPLNPANNPQGARAPGIQDAEGAMLVINLVHRQQRGRALNPGQLDLAMMRASLSVSLVQSLVLTSQTIVNAVYRVKLTKDILTKIELDKAKCDANLICLESDCKGFTHGKDGEFDPEKSIQLSFCLDKSTRNCGCREVNLPHYHLIPGEDYFDELEKFQKALKAESEDYTPSCDDGNRIDMDSNSFGDEIKGACRNHDELKRLRKRGQAGWDWSLVTGNGLQWSFDWNDQGDKCDMSCEDVFSIFKKDSKCVWNGGMSKSGFVKTKCGIASYSVDKPNPPVCLKYPFGAPRGKQEVEHEGGKGTSVDVAVEQWCNDIDGQKLIDSPEDSKRTHVRRFGFGHWGVPDRQSYWLKAEYAKRPGCQGHEFPHKTNCHAAIKEGLDTCNPGEGRTGGLSMSGIGCIDYSIHVTDMMQDDNPPWRKAPNRRFPAPEYLPGKGLGGKPHTPVCYEKNTQLGRSISNGDLEKAIAAFCVNGGKMTGMDNTKYFHYPPKGQTQFYDDKLKMHLNFGSETGTFYDDQHWCDGYDGKMGQDDCTYAFRRLLGECNKVSGKFKGGDFTYRCVHYTIFHTNEA